MNAMSGRRLRAGATREAILVAAERLYAEHGVFAVSNRQISDAAGQGNNAAVGYHFGTKTDLVRAIVSEHTAQIERLRESLLTTTDDAADVRTWVACLVRPGAEHLARLGTPTWFARFSAQIMTDPGMRSIMEVESLSSPSLRRILDGLRACLPDLPDPVRSERAAMARQLLLHMPAERERALAEGVRTPRATWDEFATGLIDAITAIWLAPATPDESG